MPDPAFYACPVCNRTSDEAGACEEHDPPAELEAIFMYPESDDLDWFAEVEYRPDGPDGEVTQVKRVHFGVHFRS